MHKESKNKSTVKVENSDTNNAISKFSRKNLNEKTKNTIEQNQPKNKKQIDNPRKSYTNKEIKNKNENTSQIASQKVNQNNSRRNSKQINLEKETIKSNKETKTKIEKNGQIVNTKGNQNNSILNRRFSKQINSEKENIKSNEGIKNKKERNSQIGNPKANNSNQNKQNLKLNSSEKEAKKEHTIRTKEKEEEEKNNYIFNDKSERINNKENQNEISKKEFELANKKNENAQSNKSNINEMKGENKSQNDKVKEESQKYNENKSYINYNIDIKKNSQKNEGQLKSKRNYDISIRIESLNQLLRGWEIKYDNDGMKKYLDMRNREILLISILGLKNKGKSYIISKLLKENEYEKEENDQLYLKYVANNQKNFNYAIIDTPGLGRSLKKDENINYSDDKYIKELEKYNTQIDNFIINFILKKSNFIICVVGLLDFNEQKLINKLKSKDEEYQKEYKRCKKIFIIHNLKELSSKDEVIKYINNVLLKSLTFNLIEKEGNLAQNISNINSNSKYFIEKNNNQEIEIYHLIVAKANTEAGNYYNESTFNFIIQQYNSFHSFIKFDIIKEIKEEIQLISKQIFTKSITSLDDFEEMENKIKLKNNFELYNNSDDNINTDFSYLTLKPKYSYYKINNNSQLLIIVEMPGQIIDLKFVCNKKPKNGYYIMTFSGKKVLSLPENVEEQKKLGSFYTNIEYGEFKENIKINVENFQLVSTKFKAEAENNGIYKYYFDIINDSSSISSDD